MATPWRIVGIFTVLELGPCYVVVIEGRPEVYTCPIGGPHDNAGSPLGLVAAPLGALLGWRRWTGELDPMPRDREGDFRSHLSRDAAQSLARRGFGSHGQRFKHDYTSSRRNGAAVDSGTSLTSTGIPLSAPTDPEIAR